MFRFIAAIAYDIPLSQTSVYRRASGRTKGWLQPVDTAQVAVWTSASPQTRLAARVVKQGQRLQCIIGKDFARTAGDKAIPRDAQAQLNERYGGYVSIHHDAATGLTSILRDPTGRLECWRIQTPGADLYFSHWIDVEGLIPNPTLIDWSFIRHFLRVPHLWGALTAVTDVTELEPGSEIQYSKDGPTKPKTRWTPHLIALDRFPSAEESAAALRDASDRTVSDWFSAYDRVALLLSGGLDSTIVLGLLRRHLSADAITGFNYYVAEHEGDERSYARDAALMHGVALHEMQFAVDDLEPPPSIQRRLLRPSMRAIPVGVDQLTKRGLTRSQADALATGIGGDHVFFADLSLSSLADYRRHCGLRGLVSASHRAALGANETIWAAVAAAFTSQSTLEAVVSQMDNPFLKSDQEDASLLRKFAPTALLESEGRTTPAKLLQIAHFCELQRHYARFGYADLADEIHPLFSQPVFEASLRIPAYWFSDGYMPRSLARSAFSDLIPDSVRLRASKTGVGSHWARVIQRHLLTYRDLLLDGELSSNGLLDRDRLSATLTPTGLAAAKSQPPILACLAAELWVQSTQ